MHNICESGVYILSNRKYKHAMIIKKGIIMNILALVEKLSFLEIIGRLGEGFLSTLAIFGLTLVLALPLGLLVAFGSMSRFKPIKWLSRTLVWIIRGTPLILQIIVIFYGPGLIGWDTSFLSRFGAVILAFTINYAAYFSEIYRGGIESMPKGQYEAAYLLGMNKFQAFTKVIIPQVYKRILPPMGNEIITLVKDTSLARVIAVGEIIMVAEEMSNVYALVWPLLFTGFFYLAFNGMLTLLFSYLEKRNSRWA